MKLCRDCIHHFDVRDGAQPYEYAKCARTRKERTDPVSGERIADFEYCSTERKFEDSGECGPGARWFEPIETRSAA